MSYFNPLSSLCFNVYLKNSCFNFGVAKHNALPKCIGAAHYCSVICCETFVQYGMDDREGQFSLELCCSSCRFRKTPFCAPLCKFEQTCLCTDCKCALPVDEDVPLEIGVCGWIVYSKVVTSNSHSLSVYVHMLIHICFCLKSVSVSFIVCSFYSSLSLSTLSLFLSVFF